MDEDFLKQIDNDTNDILDKLANNIIGIVKTMGEENMLKVLSLYPKHRLERMFELAQLSEDYTVCHIIQQILKFKL